MALQTSGAISLNEIHIEAGGSSGTQVSMNDSDVRGLIGKSSASQMSFNEWYGASATQAFTKIKAGHTYATYTGGRGSTQYAFSVGYNATASTVAGGTPPSGSIDYTGDIVVSGTTLGVITKVRHAIDSPVRARISFAIQGTNSNSGWTNVTWVSTATNGVTHTKARTFFTYSYSGGERIYTGSVELLSAGNSWHGSGSNTDSSIMGPTTGSGNGTGTTSSFNSTMTFT